MKKYNFLAFFCLLGISSFAKAEVAVVVNAACPLVEMTEVDLGRIFFGKAEDVNGVKLGPVDQPETSETRKAFYMNAFKKNAQQVKAYWYALVFTGKGVPPRTAENEQQVLNLVASNAGSVGYIGYVDKLELNEKVKVVYTVR